MIFFGCVNFFTKIFTKDLYDGAMTDFKHDYRAPRKGDIVVVRIYNYYGKGKVVKLSSGGTHFSVRFDSVEPIDGIKSDPHFYVEPRDIIRIKMSDLIANITRFQKFIKEMD